MTAPSALSKPVLNQVEVFQRIVTLVFLLLVTLLLYVFLHESGHALLGVAFGGKLTSFSINFWDFSAHAGLTGDFTFLERSLISLAGVGLPLLLWAIFLLLAPKKSDPVLEWFKISSTVMVLNTLLAWIIIPFLYMAGSAPGDDSTNFLNVSGVQPLFVSGVALVFYLYGWVLLLSRVEGLPGLVARLRRFKGVPFWTRSSRTTLSGLFAVSAAAVLISLGIINFYPFADMLAGPEGYTPAFSLDLMERSYQSETVYRFQMEEPGQISLFFALKDVQQGPVRITLNGPQGYENIFLSGDSTFSAGQMTLHPSRIPLEKGAYRLVVTFPQASGKVTGFWQAEPVLE